MPPKKSSSSSSSSSDIKRPKRTAADSAKNYSEDKNEEGTEAKKSKKSGGASASRASKRFVTNGFADPQRNYEGSYNNMSAPKPPPADGEVTETGLPPPKRNSDGELVFDDQKEFRPNLSPKQVLQMGSFGGTYFRPIFSSVTGKVHKDAYKEFPEDWFEGLDIKKQITSTEYKVAVNNFKVSCGGSLDMWEMSGWINSIDPLGWFHWYCRFYLGRRSTDDERQIGRFNRCAGPTGRFRLQLINKCVKAETTFSDRSISPVIRQSLQHWGYELTKKDFDAYCKKKGYKTKK